MTTTALQTVQSSEVMSAETLEALVVGGDLSKLNADQRMQYYRARCDAAGLDYRVQPFQYLSLSGKLTLYATKGATDQLISNRCLTVEIVNRGAIGDLYEAVCRVKFADGHHVEDLAAVTIAGLKGEPLANAVMKCVTKAKRRTVLSACGLGMMDELETETIPGAHRVTLHGEIVDAEPIRRQIEAPQEHEAHTIAPRDPANDAHNDELQRIANGGKDHAGDARKSLNATFGDIAKAVNGATSADAKSARANWLAQRGLKSTDELRVDAKVLIAFELKADGTPFRLLVEAARDARWADEALAKELAEIPDTFAPTDSITAGEIDGDLMAAANG